MRRRERCQTQWHPISIGSHLEKKKGVKSVLVKAENLRIAFELPSKEK